MAYHNLHAINNVVTALDATESARLVADRIFIRGLVDKSIGSMEVNANEQQATVVPGSVEIEHKGTTSRQTSIHPQIQSTE